jgi:hypothetical protein
MLDPSYAGGGGIVTCASRSDPTDWVKFKVNRVEAASGYSKIWVQFWGSGGGAFSTAAGDFSLGFVSEPPADSVYEMDASGTSHVAPPSGGVRFNNTTPSSVTAIWMDNLDAGGDDVATWITGMAAGGRIRFAEPGDPKSRWNEYQLTATPTLDTDHYDLSVTFVDGPPGSHPTDDAKVLVTYGPPGAAGATGPTGPAGTTGATGVTGAKPAGQIFLTAAGMWPLTDNGAAAPTKVEFDTNDIDLFFIDFADGGTKLYCMAAVVMPSDWDGGTVTATPYWTANSTSTNPVLWGVAGRSYGNFETIDQAMGSEQTSQDALNGTANQVAIGPATSAITLGGTPAAGELVVFKISRDPTSGSDTLAATARLIGVMIGYTRS